MKRKIQYQAGDGKWHELDIWDIIDPSDDVYVELKAENEKLLEHKRKLIESTDALLVERNKYFAENERLKAVTTYVMGHTRRIANFRPEFVGDCFKLVELAKESEAKDD